MQKFALIPIEFQHEWLDPKGKLYHRVENKAVLEESYAQAQRVIAHARQHEQLIMHSGLSFRHDYQEMGRTNQGLRAHIPQRRTFLEGEIGSQFYGDFKPQENELCVQGRLGSSAFAGSNLSTMLANHRVEKLYLMGYALHVCVESTLRQAHDLGFEVDVIIDASAAFNQQQKDYFCENVINHFGRLITTDEYIKKEKK